MEVLESMEQEFQEIIDDIKKHPDHMNDYDIVGCMKEIEKRSIICTLKEVENACANKKQTFSENLISIITEKQV